MERTKYLRIISGIRPLCFFEESIVFSKGNRLFISDLEIMKYKEIAKLNTEFVKQLIFRNHIMARIFRYGPNNAISLENKDIMVSANGGLFTITLNEDKQTVYCDHRFRKEMRNTLSLTNISNMNQFDNSICYGEYFNNPEKKEVHIWIKTTRDKNWRIVYTFKAGLMEHIHAIIPDHIRDIVWILTGDFNESAGFWIARNNFKTVEPVAIGKQELRACVAFPISEGLLYATDSQFESNSIRMLKTQNNQWQSEFVYPLEGSCIHACQLGDEFVFSTVVEPGEEKANFILNLLERKPGPGIKSSNSEIVIGNCQKGFQSIGKWAKDCWPPRLCQFGTITFPTGSNPTNKIYGYGIGLKGIDGKTFIIER